jgi:hypothetical protein
MIPLPFRTNKSVNMQCYSQSIFLLVSANQEVSMKAVLTYRVFSLVCYVMLNSVVVGNDDEMPPK